MVSVQQFSINGSNKLNKEQQENDEGYWIFLKRTFYIYQFLFVTCW